MAVDHGIVENTAPAMAADRILFGPLVWTPVVVTRSLTERGLAGKPFGEGLRSEAGRVALSGCRVG
jgi:hypothetical protein